MKSSLYLRFGKRALDLAIAGPVALAAAPIVGVLAVAVSARMGSPVFFRQQRPGLGGKPFHVYKMRTMNDARDEQGRLLPDDQRLTALGQWIRSKSLDELPQLWNVLRGDMSLVGPRPLLMQYLERYDAEQARRHDVKPGITGWAQIHGRNALTWEEKFRLDVHYVDHVSAALDLRILAKTIGRVLFPEGISAAGHATMPEFMGSPKVPAAEGASAA